jgi:CheY-like chemotaxis protein
MKDCVILIVEDDPILRKMTQSQISMLCSCTAEGVSTGEEAVNRAHSDISLIFMDVGLPGIDGSHATLLIREKELNERRKRVPIIALTAHSDRQRTIMAGMDDFLQKPALLDDIKRILQKWLPENCEQQAI